LQLSSLSLATAFKWLVSAHAGHTGSELVRESASVIAKNTSIEKPFSRTTSLNETPAPRA
ncbi:hypothetical protein RX909_01690, partial [Pseudomonas syringae pv. actinidiae]|nr:hypothetical protein [Pseudomonas syringae pv. actinidiae]